MREIILEDNPSKRQIFVDDNKPDFSYLSNKDKITQIFPL